MFWIDLELSNSKMGLINKLSLLFKKFNTLKENWVAKSGNTGWDPEKQVNHYPTLEQNWQESGCAAINIFNTHRLKKMGHDQKKIPAKMSLISHFLEEMKLD